MCDYLEVSRSGYYKWRSAPVSNHAREDAELTAIIRKIHTEGRGNPGVRRVHAGLVALGRCVSRKRVLRLMQAADLQGRHPKAWKRTTVKGESPLYAKDLIKQDFTAERPNIKWAGDITYIKTWDGWAYLATVIDLHSRKVVGWAIADHMHTTLIIEALEMAYVHRKPPAGVTFHSDRGTQYTSRDFAKYCKSRRILRSMGRTGTCYDNAVSESFFATYKKELIHTRPWPDIKYLRRETFDWIETYYNVTRRHSTLDYLTPSEYEIGFRQLSELAA
jgi:transposase InsO family protein